MTYVPSVGGSRYGLVKTVPRTHYMSTIDPPGTFDTISSYTINGGSVAMNDYDLAANLPPDLRDTTPPTQPTSLVYSLLKGTSTAKVVLSWTASVDNVKVSGYYIYRNGRKIGASATPTYADYFGSPTGTLYSYRVIAFDPAGNLSNASNTVYVSY